MEESTLSRASTVTRSLLSRVAAPFTSKPQALSDFHIQLEEPHRYYSPGDVVKGAVILVVAKRIRITHLVVCLHGFAQVFTRGATLRGRGARSYIGADREEQESNGLKPIFREEVVLSGDGRLEASIYEFKFELAFPGCALPSSIEVSPLLHEYSHGPDAAQFERGRVSYTVSATLTRPTTISPLSTCDRKLSLVERIDVGRIPLPKPLWVAGKGAARHSKPETRKQELVTPEALEDTGTDTTHTSGQSGQGSIGASNGEQQDSPHSSEPEGIGTANATSESWRRIWLGPRRRSSHNQELNRPRSPDNLPSAKVELSSGGCLPGDRVPLKITIHHLKPIKSLHGVIITFYRESRINYDQWRTIKLDEKDQKSAKAKTEYYYPKSWTGLGALSLSSMGTSSVFRKDLSQTFAPLIIDPYTLQSVVQVSFKVPDDVFPTISSIPGQMMSFRYHVEVVIDLYGKLVPENTFLARIGMLMSPLNYVQLEGQRFSEPVDYSGLPPAFEGSLIDTLRLRRQVSVGAGRFEVVVGTVDSTRSQNKRTDCAHSPTEHQQVGLGTQVVSSSSASDVQLPPDQDNSPSAPDYDGREYSEHRPWHIPTEQREGRTVIVPPPQLDEPTDEKERIRQAEERLLPSQPPGLDDDDAAAASAGPSHPGPSAPAISDIDGEASLSGPAHWEAHPDTAAAVPSAPPLHHVLTPGERPIEHVGHGTYPVASAAATEDKQELERRRLQAAASSPDDYADPADGDSAPTDDAAAAAAATTNPSTSTSSSHPPHPAPSAPVLTEHDEYDGHRYGYSYGYGYANTNNGLGSEHFLDPDQYSSEEQHARHHQGLSERLPRYER